MAVKGYQVRVGIKAPGSVPVDREELAEAKALTALNPFPPIPRSGT